MKVKALVNFSGVITMRLGEIRDIENELLYEDLIQAGYVEDAKTETPRKLVLKKKVNTDES